MTSKPEQPNAAFIESPEDVDRLTMLAESNAAPLRHPAYRPALRHEYGGTSKNDALIAALLEPDFNTDEKNLHADARLAGKKPA